MTIHWWGKTENVSRIRTFVQPVTGKTDFGRWATFQLLAVLFFLKDPPSEPQNLQVNNINKDFVILSWERPSSDGGSPITGYCIEKKERNSLLWVKANESLVKATQYTCTGLIEGLEYTFRVSALNLAGQGKPCKQTDLITARTAVGRNFSLLFITIIFQQSH